MSQKLTIELVPKSAWYKNLRSMVSAARWDEVRNACYHKAKYQCEICGGRGPKHPVECHEIWEYDLPTQTLVGLIALCPDCHEVKHIGLAQKNGRLRQATQHLAKVNNWSVIMAELYVKEAFKLWEKRSNYCWEAKIDWLQT